MEILTQETTQNRVMASMQNEELCTYLVCTTATTIFAGYNNILDREYCEEKGYTIVDVGNEGGVIVGGDGDVNYVVIARDEFDTEMFNAVAKFKEFLTSKGLEFVEDSNDILIDGFKVASYSSRRHGNIVLYTFHMSYSVNLKLIKKLCNKPMNKTPKGLKDFGITKQELKGLFLED